MPVGGIFVESMFGAKTRQPIVKLILQDESAERPPVAEVEMSPAKARQIGEWLMRCAEAAETDAFVVKWAAEVFADEDDPAKADQAAIMLLRELRAFRELSRRAGVEQEERDEQIARDRYQEPPHA